MTPFAPGKQAYLQSAVKERPDLLERLQDAIINAPELGDLFVDVIEHVQNVWIDISDSKEFSANEPSSKKRKINSTTKDPIEDNIREDWPTGSFYAIKDISFSIPQRKKLTLEIGKLPEQGLRARNPTSGELEFVVKWKEMENVVCLPLPEKAQPQYNFCVFPKISGGAESTSDGSEAEQMLWTVPCTVPKPGIIGAGVEVKPDDTYDTLLLTLVNEALEGIGKRIVRPDVGEFVSQTSQPHKKGEKAVHVKAFRGSKDGYLFFLSTGIVWGFKKPLAFFPFDLIDSMSYTSILQRTFNLNIIIHMPSFTAITQELEFSMLDQIDFAGIDAYIKRHHLQDASMAQERQAKKLNINGVKKESAAEGEGGEVEKVLKAERDAEGLGDDDDDEEDDDNFDPGSGGESEGSGTSDEEDDGGDEGGEQNLAEKEMNSEEEDD